MLVPGVNPSHPHGIELLGQSGVNLRSFALQSLQLDQQPLLEVCQLFLLQGLQLDLFDLVLVFDDQLKEDLALLPKLSGLVLALCGSKVSLEEAREEFLGREGCFLI